jgi:hypothetical protein
MARLADSASVLEDAVKEANSPDIITFGFQEVVDLNDRKVTAKVMVVSDKKHAKVAANPSEVSDRVSSAYRRWVDKLTSVAWQASTEGEGYALVATDHLVGLLTAVFVKTSLMPYVTECNHNHVKTGMGGRYGNKVRFTCSA